MNQYSQRHLYRFALQFIKLELAYQTKCDLILSKTHIILWHWMYVTTRRTDYLSAVHHRSNAKWPAAAEKSEQRQRHIVAGRGLVAFCAHKTVHIISKQSSKPEILLEIETYLQPFWTDSYSCTNNVELLFIVSCCILWHQWGNPMSRIKTGNLYEFNSF